MRDRWLILAWVGLFVALASSLLYAQLTYEGRRLGGGGGGGRGAIETSPDAKGSETGVALTGAPPQGDGPSGRAFATLNIAPSTNEPPPAPGPISKAKPQTSEPPPPARIAFAAPPPPTDGRPRIAVIVSEIGLSRARSRQAIDRLPGAVTLAVMAYVAERDEWVQAARAANHEVLLAAPMEPRDYPRFDPGPEPLLADMDDLENLARYDKVLHGARGVVGVLAHMGGRFLGDALRLRPILAATHDRGLIFVDNRSAPENAVAKLAHSLDLHILQNDRFVDAEPSREAIVHRLAELEQIAASRGYAVGLATPYPVTIEQIRIWAEGLKERGFTLTPVSALARIPTLAETQ